MLDIDDTLTAWYGSVLNDIGDTENMRTGWRNHKTMPIQQLCNYIQFNMYI
jgi:hypothetical protein